MLLDLSVAANESGQALVPQASNRYFISCLLIKGDMTF